MTTPYRLSIGIDFGVCTSGVSYCLLRPNEAVSSAVEIEFGGEGKTLVPSALGVNGNWGNDIAAGEDKFTLFKLKLLHTDDLLQSYRQTPEQLTFVRDALGKIERAGKTDIDVVAEYLRRLWAFAADSLSVILRRKGLISLSDLEARFVFGIPAVWGVDTRSRMEQAIQHSGLFKLGDRPPAPLDFIAEPEAAAIAMFPRLAVSYNLQDGQTVVICDCGGGTVDVISYEITSLEPLTVREIVSGEGQLLGDMFMKSALVALIKSRVQEDYRDNADLDLADLDNEIEAVWDRVSKIQGNTMRRAGWCHRLDITYVDGRIGRQVVLSGRDVLRALNTCTDSIVRLLRT
ncbi:uncharacterized protein B0T15DRAFT_213985 [Chaetomium strumarium]|uniref:Uncharacterized protein n=1 Tax=Chaetomium strumarium TaxID=1170767 RepID=A0AAJ0M1U6_9PEZI|nr:hypothetical protein B0T15DRAFT_213985 [Chaetomium strumarium]